MKKILLFLSIITLWSCSILKQSNKDNQTKFCQLAPPLGKQFAFGEVRTLWKKDTIYYYYLGGTPLLQAKIDLLVTQWSDLGRIKFVRTNTRNQSQIRISFAKGGSWSYVGTDNLSIGKNYATMQFGWLTDKSDDTEIRRVVLHEFGHAIGLQHEHQHPQSGIHWNKEAIYAEYAKYGWNRSMVDNNLFKTFDADQTNFTSYDPTSIMHYPIPKEHTTDGYSVGWNTTLSENDKNWIKTYYPQKCICR